MNLPTYDPTERTAERKPLKGEKLLAQRDRSQLRQNAEKKLMRECVRLDERTCRVPRCEYVSKKLPIDACHKVHRGMGGNPRLDRTTLETLISFCRIHHSDYDAGRLDVDEHDAVKGFRGKCDYYTVAPDGRRTHIGSDKIIGVSVERTVR